MYADVACSTGWTWEYIGQEMTLPRLGAMAKHWAQYPPVHKAVAALLGIKPAPAAAAKPLTNADLWRDIKADPRKLEWKAANDGR